MGKSRNQAVRAAYAFKPAEGYGSLISFRWRVRLCYSLFLSLSLFPVNPPIFLSSLSGDWAFAALLWCVFSPSVHCGSLGGMVHLTDQNQGKVATSNDPINCEPATGWCFCFIRFSHIFREINQVADRIAKLGMFALDEDWKNDLELAALIRKDALGWSYTRHC